MLIFAAGTYFGYCIFLAANEKLTVVSVRAPAKSHVPGPHIGKSGCRLENCSATASLIIILYAVCVNTPNYFCLTSCDVVSYNDVDSATNSFVFV